MSDHEELPSETAPRGPRYKRIRKRHFWLRDRYDPTKEERQKWAAAGLPPDIEIIAGFLMNNPLVFNVPERSEIFRLARQCTEEDTYSVGDRRRNIQDLMRLRIIKSWPIPTVRYTLAEAPFGLELGGLVEHQFNVRLCALSDEMVLDQIRIISGSEQEPDQPLVFDGTEFPGAAVHRKIRIVRVTVYAPNFAIWGTRAETTYPDWGEW